MAKTGESYTAARRMPIASGDRPEAEAPAFAPPTSEEAVVEATGRGWAAVGGDARRVGGRGPHRARGDRRAGVDGGWRQW